MFPLQHPTHFLRDGMVVVDGQPTKPGRYLARYKLPAWEVEYWSHLPGPFHLHFSKDFLHVYTYGPHSCMKGEDCVEVWAKDFEIAFLTDAENMIVARAIVHRERKIAFPCYGEHKIYLEFLLKDYEAPTYENVKGLSLTKVYTGDNYVCPYVDDVPCLRIGSDGLYFDNDNYDHTADRTDGYLIPDYEFDEFDD